MKEKIIAVVGFIISVISAVFYVLFCQKKEEKLKADLEQEKKEKENLQHFSGNVIEAINANVDNKVENEEEVQFAHSGNHLSNFFAGLNLLRK